MRPELYAAMDRLNAAARAPDMPKKAIYALKRSLITLADEAGHAHHRLVTCPDLVCLVCQGTGQWWGAWKVGAESCRSCSGRGKKTLSFVESTIWVEESWIWHSPLPGWELEGLVRGLLRAGCRARETGWRPLQEPVPYPDEAAMVADLVLVEELLGAQDYAVDLEKLPVGLRARWRALHPTGTAADHAIPF